jgi:FAD/FMN-containing dehydrogenase
VLPELAALEGVIEGEVVLPGSPGYERARRPAWAQYENVRPEAVVRCRTPTDVSEAIAVARHLGLETATRSGGHCFAGRSSTKGLVIDVSPMCSVSLADRIATVAAGACLGDIYGRLELHGLTIAAGSCPSVGIAGLTLGGGLGIMGRRYGLTSDQLLEAQVVLADGRVVDCDEHRHEDLFWALRGAGAGHLGVVTRFAFRAIPAQELTCFQLVWPHASAAALLQVWQSWAPRAPNEIAASLLMNASGNPERQPTVTLFGAMLDTESQTERSLNELIAGAGTEPTAAVLEHLAFAAARRYLAEHAPAVERLHLTPAGKQTPALVYNKSEFFRQPLPHEAIRALIDHFTAARVSGQTRELDFTPWGGAYNRVHPNATAFVHRNEHFLLKHAVTLDHDASTQQRDDAREWLARSWALVHPHGSGGVFPNFPDPDLADSPRAYHGANYDRIASVKTKYDPDNVFRAEKRLAIS